jgi:(hydroxyamino)benzene mutase
MVLFMRHPDDPDTVPDTKIVAAFCLSVLGATTGLALGGVVPATIALVLARQGGRELEEGRGWRTGARYLAWARRLAWLGLGLAAMSLVILVVVRLLQDSAGVKDFPPNVN